MLDLFPFLLINQNELIMDITARRRKREKERKKQNKNQIKSKKYFVFRKMSIFQHSKSWHPLFYSYPLKLFPHRYIRDTKGVPYIAE